MSLRSWTRAPATKRLIRREAVQRLLARLVACYIRLVYRTSRWTTQGAEHPRRFWEQGQPFLGCFWHGRMLMIAYAWDFRRPLHMLISTHADGRLIARAVERFGVRTIEGSTSSGGTAALRAMLRALKEGHSVAVTPDGPRGPRMRVAPGLVLVAKLAGVPILPGAYSSTRLRLIDSWDRFAVALPFGRGVFVWGEPIRVAADADERALAAASLEVEARLNELTAAADRLCGRAPVEPAQAAPSLAGTG